jgi:3,4-dihydroxy 2-butanone 4-phosphate synthase/GTP cyclohydrolase II
MNEDGSVAAPADLEPYCAHHGVRCVNVADVLAVRRRAAHALERVADALLPTRFGPFRAVGYRVPGRGLRPIALVRGQVEGAEEVPLAVHRACLLGDVFRGCPHGCRDRLEASLRAIDGAGSGVLVYLTGDGSDDALSRPASAPPELEEQLVHDLGIRSVRRLREAA